MLIVPNRAPPSCSGGDAQPRLEGPRLGPRSPAPASTSTRSVGRGGSRGRGALLFAVTLALGGGCALFGGAPTMVGPVKTADAVAGACRIVETACSLGQSQACDARDLVCEGLRAVLVEVRCPDLTKPERIAVDEIEELPAGVPVNDDGTVDVCPTGDGNE